MQLSFITAYKNSNKLRLYRNLVAASIEALQKIFNENQLADRVVQATLRSNKKWGSKDRRFLASTIYDMVRWYRLYYEIYGKEPLDTNDWWAVLGIMWTAQGEDLPDWETFSMLDRDIILEKLTHFNTVRKIKASIPDWLDELGQKELGQQWEKCLEASNQAAPLVLRANSLKTSREDLMQVLQKKGVQSEKLDSEDALLIPTRTKLTNTPSYERGYFEIQDASSQEVAYYLDVEPGMFVVDACAGAGGKTLHLAALMHDRGSLIALDLEADKLAELEKRAKRAAISILETRLIKHQFTIPNLYDTADRLLLDVPCSGLGTLRRSPQIKWRLTADFLAKIKTEQQKILQGYARICKPGGQMVYATCSILPSENQEQVKTFLASESGKDFTLIKEKSILPQDNGFDGFYMALIERKNTKLGSW